VLLEINIFIKVFLFAITAKYFRNILYKCIRLRLMAGVLDDITDPWILQIEMANGCQKFWQASRIIQSSILFSIYRKSISKLEWHTTTYTNFWWLPSICSRKWKDCAN